jgi:2-oxoglutarate dehydrogenase E2 component (dihydrolipoamide succinyltransferase)
MDIRIPAVGESIHEALLATWRVADGAVVRQGDVLCDLETDKVNVEVTAEITGTVQIGVPPGQTLPVGAVIGAIVPGAVPDEPPPAEAPQAPPAAKPAPPPSPGAAKLAREKEIDPGTLAGSGRSGQVTVEDVLAAPAAAAPKVRSEEQAPYTPTPAGTAEEAVDGRPVTREAMSPLRQRIAARLLAARQQTAMLTTFNEADLGLLKALRARHQEHFTSKHGIKLGLMSFFVKATVEALKDFPAVNARIDGSDIVYHH